MTFDELGPSLAAFVGRHGPTVPGQDRVSRAMIRQWCEVIGDINPAYQLKPGDPLADARQIAPPAMLQVWTMPGYGAGRRLDALTAELYARLDAQGYTSIIATDSEQDYLHYLHPGDSVTARRSIAEISNEKTTRLGSGVFITSVIEVRRGDRTLVGRQVHRVLKFKLRGGLVARAGFAASNVVSEPAPPLTALPEPVQASEVVVGTLIPRLVIPITRSFVVASAIVSRDFEDIHHDDRAACQRGAPDIFTNITTTSGLVSRLVTDWAGPSARVQRIAVKLAGQNHPGDTLTLTGLVSARTEAASKTHLRLQVDGVNERGPHVGGYVDIML